MLKKLLLVGFIILFSSFALSAFAGVRSCTTEKMQKLEVQPQLIDRLDGFTGSTRGLTSAPPQMNSILIDSARNGYGWYIADQHSADYATDLFGTAWGGWCYRKFVPGDPNTGIIGVAELNIDAGFDYANITFWDYINNMPNYGIGGRYPSFVATPEGPVPIWTQFQADGTPTVADAFLSFDFFGWGPSGGGFIPPVSWSQNSNPVVIHSLWKGSTDIVKDPNGTWHIGGIWEIDLNTNDYTCITGESTDLMTWNFENAVVDWPVSLLTMNSPRLNFGSNGFGAWVSTGFFTGSPEEDYKILVCTTNDYGITWSQVKQLEWSDVGIPTEITYDDSIYVPDPQNPGQYILYSGPAYVGITYDFDAVVLPNNEIHIGATISWGPEAGPTSYYPNGLWMGLYDIHSSDMGQTWTASRVWWNAGLLEGDSTGSWVTTNEIDLGYDDNGNIYMVWLDRDRTNIVPSPYPRSNTNITDHYNLDIWASMSMDGGNTWTDTVRVTDDQTVCHYGLRLTTRVKSGLNKTYMGYMIADYSRPLTPPIERQADHVQWYYLAEADFSNVSISNSGGTLPSGIHLAQNYPNPFNPSTNIRFRVDKKQDVELAVYNTLGQKVAVLLDGPVSAGEHQITWNAADFATGIYFLQLKAGHQVKVRKMMLVR